MRKLYLLIGFLLFLTGCGQPKQPSTWSIVAVDPATGDVGVAAASCVSVHIDALAALVPNVGAAATQAAFDIGNRNQVFERLKAGQSADQIIDEVTAVDQQRNSRQYGIITMADGNAKIAGFTGSENDSWAGHKTAQAIFPVTVQGNILESEAVVTAALEAFNDNTVGNLTLSDRLMRALEAGSAAGGDKRCNETVQQTAAAAFILMARGNDAPFAVQEIGSKAAEQEAPLFLALSISEPIGGANPIIELRQQYDQWRSQTLPDCPNCDLTAIPVPAGDNSQSAQRPQTIQTITLWAIIGGIFLLLLLLIIGAYRWWHSRQV